MIVYLPHENFYLSFGGGMPYRTVRSIVLLTLIAASAALFTSSHARAEDAKKQFAGYTKYVWYRAHYDVNADGTHVETTSWALKVLGEQGVARAQEASVSVSDRLEKLEILSAYTLKADGRKINVPPTNYQQMAAPETGAVSSLGYGPMIVATTFKDYGALAAAYDARAKTKATPTDAIKKLANELTQNARTPREIVKALYDWVAQNIKFA